MRVLAPALVLCPALLLGACAPLVTPLGVALTAGATGGTMAMQERGLGAGIEDNAIALAINNAWLAEDPAIFRKVTTSIHDGMVVLTGHVTWRETAERAEVLARGVDGVRAVTNHIQLAPEPGMATAAADRWITTRLRLGLTFKADVNAVNYAFDTVDGTVYVSGVARDQAELGRVVAHVRATPGVRDVVTTVRLRTEPLPPKNTAALVAAPYHAPAPAQAAVRAEPLPPMP